MSGIDGLTTAMHDTLCGCGARCAGWENDKAALLAFAEERWGSPYTFERYLEGGSE